METNQFDVDNLRKSIFGAMACSIAKEALQILMDQMRIPLQDQTNQHVAWLKLQGILSLK